MVRNFLRMSAFSAMLLAGSSQVFALDSQDSLNSALTAWRTGDLKSAQAQLTTLIDAGSSDPRLYFYRGILATQLGQDGDADFQKGAQLEAETGNTRSVNSALERTQGTLRARIEKFRRDARADYKPDPKAVKAAATFREALEDRRSGNLKAALSKLESLTDGGTDPRYYYMHGVVLAESGDREKAKAAFSEGLKRETTLEHVTLVNELLSSVQGEVRQLVEESATLESGETQVTRKSNRRLLQMLAARSEDQLLAESNAATAAAERQALLELESRRRAAAEDFAAQREKPEPGVAIAQVDPPAEQPGNNPGASDSTEKPEMPAEATPATAVSPSTAAANPFLGGAAVTPMPSASTTGSESTLPDTSAPIDMSYLPEQSELLVYMRPADMLASGFMKPLADTPQFQAAIQQMTAQVGFAPADIESVTVGIANLVATIIPVMTQAASGAAPDPAAINQQLMGGSNTLSVLRLTKDIDISALAQAAGGMAVEHEGKTFYMLPAQPNQPAMGIHGIDARTVISGSEPALKSAITNGPGETARPGFEFVKSAHLVQAFSSPLLAGMSAGIPDPGAQAPPQIAALVAAIKGKITGGAIVMNFNTDASLSIILNLAEDAAATEANTALTDGLGMLQQMAPLFMGGAPQELQGPLNQVVGSLKSSASATTVRVSAGIPVSLVEAIQANPGLLMPPGAGGPGSPFGAPPR